jgi:hypothetical protein
MLLRSRKPEKKGNAGHFDKESKVTEKKILVYTTKLHHREPTHH